jgi:hypothetical protein
VLSEIVLVLLTHAPRDSVYTDLRLPVVVPILLQLKTVADLPLVIPISLLLAPAVRTLAGGRSRQSRVCIS